MANPRGCLSNNSCFRCNFCCVFTTTFISFFVFFFSALIFWISFSPLAVKFYVTEATLTQFNFTTANTTLNYNLTLTIVVRNPNRKISISYDDVKALAYYGNLWFDTVSLPPFHQGHKNTTVLQLEFEGQESVSLDDRKLSKLNSEKKAGVYNIDIDLKFRIAPKFGKIKTGHYHHTVACELKVPLSSNGTSAGGFTRTKCWGGSFFLQKDQDGNSFSFG
ncbi:Protein YLS9 [Morella rubra]|uniref:Protein YLS9 n=1 Tax=Morella rubra TaxID=262757 RepID=A0A6A1VIR8_9ROSI|nr:Protein YLS9 [Morella rubra]